MFLGFFSSFSPSLSPEFRRWLRGLPLSQGKGCRRDRAQLPRRAGCLTEPRSESVGVTKERWGFCLGGEGPFRTEEPGSGPREGPWAAGGGEEHSARRLDRATNQLGAQTAQPPRVCSGRRGCRDRRLAAEPQPPPHGWAEGRGRSKLLRASQPSVPPPPPPPRRDPERPERAAALSCLSSGSPGTCTLLHRGHHPLHTPTTLDPPPSRAFCSSRGA